MESYNKHQLSFFYEEIYEKYKKLNGSRKVNKHISNNQAKTLQTIKIRDINLLNNKKSSLIRSQANSTEFNKEQNSNPTSKSPNRKSVEFRSENKSKSNFMLFNLLDSPTRNSTKKKNLLSKIKSKSNKELKERKDFEDKSKIDYLISNKLKDCSNRLNILLNKINLENELRVKEKIEEFNKQISSESSDIAVKNKKSKSINFCCF